MTSLNNISPDRNGIDFTSHFDEEKEIVIKFIDSYTSLIFRGETMKVLPKCSYWASYDGRITKLMTFVVEDSKTEEILLQVCDYSDVFQHDVRNLDQKNKLKNILMHVMKN